MSTFRCQSLNHGHYSVLLEDDQRQKLIFTYPTIKGVTIIDAVFTQYLENIEIKHFIS